jgi:hAT family C-terminal dimerisation region
LPASHSIDLAVVTAFLLFMDAETESSIISNSIDLHTIRSESVATSASPSIVGRNRSARIDPYTRKPLEGETERDENQKKLHYCAVCATDDTYKTNVSSNMVTHLKSKHGIDVNTSTPTAKATAATQLVALWRQAKGTQAASSLGSDVLRSIIDKEVVTKTLVTLVTAHSLPFRLVEWPEFHAFCWSLNPEAKNVIAASRGSIISAVAESFTLQKDVVRRKVQSAASGIHLAVDIWTSPNNCLLLAVCCYFVTPYGRRFKSLLALREVGGHSGEEQWSIVLQVLEDYGITCNLGTITGDNSTTNDTLCRKAAEHLSEQLSMGWDPEVQRIRCQGHTINLVVQAFLFSRAQQASLQPCADGDEANLADQADADTTAQKEERFREMGLLGRLHNIIVHTRSSPGRMKQFKSLAGRMVPLDNSTRWNSWHSMLSVALKKEAAVDGYIKANFKSLEKDVLGPQDWEDLRAISHILEPFHFATMDTQGDKATLDQTIISMDTLNEHLKRCATKHKSNPDIASRIERATQKLKDYYTKIDASILYYAAVVFNPNLRTKYITSTRKKDVARRLLARVEAVWIAYRDSNSVPEPVAYETPATAPPADRNTYSDIRQELIGRAVRPRSQDEYKDYCSETPYEIDKPPIAWWSDRIQQKRFPRLSALAIDILCIPAMSDEPERVFSGGRHSIPWERMRLGAEPLERLECMKNWHHAGILRDGTEGDAPEMSG